MYFTLHTIVEAKAELEKQVRTLTAEIEQRSSESPVLRHASAFGAGESLAHLDIGATSDQQEVRDLWVQLDHRTSQVADLEDKVAIMEEVRMTGSRLRSFWTLKTVWLVIWLCL